MASSLWQMNSSKRSVRRASAGLRLAERRNLHRVHGDKRGLNQVLLYLLVKAGIQGVAPCLIGRVGQLHAPRPWPRPRPRHHRKWRQSQCPHTSFTASTMVMRRPAGGQVYLLAHPLHLISAQNFFGRAGDDALGNIHHVVEIGIGLIQLDGGELGVVLGVHALVAEDAANFVHAVHARPQSAA